MRLNYKRIGQYVRQVKARNKDLTLSEPRGIKITKEFMPSVANTIGTDLSEYKVVAHEQFAYNPMHVGRDEVLPISMLANDKSVIVSPAYTVFEIIDKDGLLPEYLMMWCRRSEFDRNAWFTTDSSVRGGFSWESFCNMELPVPSIETQREIVQEYNVIVNRIKLNEQLNQKLEETAQAIYKHWFVDFEFPISAEYASSIGKPELEGKPYKSNGGEMVYCEELDLDIPLGWESRSLDNVVTSNPTNFNKKDVFDKILYLDTGSITNNKIESFKELCLKKDIIPSSAKRTVIHNDIIYSKVRPNLRHYGILKNPKNNIVVSTGFCVLRIKNIKLSSELVYMWLTSDKITEYLHSKAEMSVSTYPSIKPEDLLEIKIPFPSDDVLLSINKIFIPPFKAIDRNNCELGILKHFSTVIHQKMTKAAA